VSNEEVQRVRYIPVSWSLPDGSNRHCAASGGQPQIGLHIRGAGRHHCHRPRVVALFTGNIGIFPGTAYIPGTPAVTVNGTVYAGGPVAAQAQSDLTTAYNDAAGRSLAPATVSGNIGGQTLAPGLYKSTSSLSISSGNLTLDAQGNANAVWIFQIASTLTTTSGRQVILANGANAANVFWQVGSSATIGTTSVFQGNILAAVSISLLTGSTISGRALAIGGAVSIDTGGGSSTTVPVAPTAPAVTSTRASQWATGVPVGSKLSATFSTAMNPSTITASTFTIRAGNGAGLGRSDLCWYDCDLHSGIRSRAPEKRLQPRLQPAPKIWLEMLWRVTTYGALQQVRPPALLCLLLFLQSPPLEPAACRFGNRLSATFSEAMDPSTISASTFTLMQGITSVSGTVSYVGVTATFAPSSGLIPGAAYTATVTSGAKDLAGNALAGNYIWSFTAGSSTNTSAPTVISTTPANGALGVATGSDIAATFSGPMNPFNDHQCNLYPATRRHARIGNGYLHWDHGDSCAVEQSRP